MRVSSSSAFILVPLLAGCADQWSPTRPSAVPASSVPVVYLEGEAGTGDGQVRDRSRASGEQTVHLGPDQHRLWAFDVGAQQATYALAVTYANGQEGPNETLHVAIDGRSVATFQNRDSGDSVDGWNLFVTDSAGTSTVAAGRHTLTLEVTDGDGCVDIDVVTLTRLAADRSE